MLLNGMTLRLVEARKSGQGQCSFHRRERLIVDSPYSGHNTVESFIVEPSPTVELLVGDFHTPRDLPSRS